MKETSKKEHLLCDSTDNSMCREGKAIEKKIIKLEIAYKWDGPKKMTANRYGVY